MLTRLLLIASLSLCVAGSALATENSPAYSPQDVIAKLRDGHERFLAGHPQEWSAGVEERELLATGQHPMACIVTCADSRVSPEILFDQSLGDLFVCRVAGNVITPEITGSIEYAVDHLGVPVVIVMGHTKCGAVQAAIASPGATGPIGSLVSHIKAAVDGCIQSGASDSELLTCAVNTNANNGCIALIQGSRAIQEKVEKGECMLVSATYDITTGALDWQTQLAAVSLSSKPEKLEDNPPVSHETQKSVSSKSKKNKTSSETQTASRSKPAATDTKHSRRY